ncbi:FAD-binding oxidoreductase [uncultured Tateyamaria sp.]|uniref:NAD(P)/FAD-dependent oxidoreductase n=1 Tax=uncultured Tateyamaria sp. TaxID=455651 RepID=UPI00262EB3B0|nr:FAD-binding oxidoreductase [uncultured Tateyamaria sp.]
MTRTAVVGAGIVGICCAIALADQGHKVTLIDKGEPGQQTSRWNAGVLATSSVIPLNNPGLFANLPRLLTGRHPGFHLNMAAGWTLLPWAALFLNNSRAVRSDRSVAALTALITASRHDHERLCARSRYDGLEQNGWLMLYRGEAGAARAAAQQQVLAARDVEAKALPVSQLAELEPHLKPDFSGVLHVTQSAHTDPSALFAAYLALATSLGITLVRNDIGRVSTSQGSLALGGSSGDLGTFDHVVLTLGPWSNDILRELGCPLPMAIERGYLQVFDSAAPLNRPIFDVDGGYVAAARPAGIQISTGTELTRLDIAPNRQRMNAPLRMARTALSLGAPRADEVIVGNRPSLPDSLPVIGAVRAVPGLWIATGHQHVGFSTSAGTASLLASLMNDQMPTIDPKPFSPSRFGL